LLKRFNTLPQSYREQLKIFSEDTNIINSQRDGLKIYTRVLNTIGYSNLSDSCKKNIIEYVKTKFDKAKFFEQLSDPNIYDDFFLSLIKFIDFIHHKEAKQTNPAITKDEFVSAVTVFVDRIEENCSNKNY